MKNLKKTLSEILVFMLIAIMLTACGSSSTSGKSSSDGDGAATKSENDVVKSDETVNDDESAVSQDSEIVNGRFTETRKITVEVYDRNNDGGTDPKDNVFANFIKEGMLRDHNIEVEFVAVPRWTETDVLNNLLAAGDAPDVCVTYSNATIKSYAKMGGVIDLLPYVEENIDKIPDLLDLLTEENLYYDLDPVTNQLWSIQAKLFNNTGQKTFVREDWLKKLNMNPPTSLEEFEAMLYAFRDNADLLLGDEADKMIPYMMAGELAFEASDMAQAMIPTNLTDKDFYVYGYDAQMFMFPNYKEVMRVFNKWYNEGLLWKDFVVYPTGDSTSDNLKKAGYVGAYSNNSNAPYGGGEDSIQRTIQRVVGDEAAYIIVPTYKSDTGTYRKYWGSPNAFSVFFPNTNDEPVASLMYLNWISKPENRIYLQVGEEGINHEVMEDSSYKMLQATGEYIMNSGNNLDYTIVLNGLNLGDEDLTLKSLAQAFPGIDPKYIMNVYDHSPYDNVYYKTVNLGEVAAETGIGQALTEKRNDVITKSIVAPVNEFDKVFDKEYQNYLDSGAQAIMDERKAKWEEVYGDKEMLDE